MAGNDNGGTRKVCSPESRSGHAAGDQHGEPRAGVQQVADHRRGRQQMLEVVEHEEQGPVAQQLLEPRSGIVPGLPAPQRLKDGRRHQLRGPDRGEGTKATPSAESGAHCSATAIARRVLPTPPGPVSVSRRTSGRRSSARRVASSTSRPISRVRGTGSGAAATWRPWMGIGPTDETSLAGVRRISAHGILR